MVRTGLLIILALLPGIALLVYFYRKDVLKKEPVRVIMASFLLGSLAVVPAGLLEYPFMGDDSASGVYSVPRAIFLSFLIIGPVEELAKFAVIRLYCYRNFHFDELMDGLVYGAAVASGFATMENIFYVLEHGFLTGIYRALVSVPMHVLTGAILGYWLARGRFTDASMLVSAGTGLLIAILAHGIFDAPLLAAIGDLFWMAPMVVIVLAILTIMHIRTALAHDEFMILNDVPISGVAVPPIPQPATHPVPVETPVTRDAEDRLAGLHGMIRSMLIGLGVLSFSFGLFMLLGVFLLASEDPATPTWMWTLSAIPVAGGVLLTWVGMTRFKRVESSGLRAQGEE